MHAQRLSINFAKRLGAGVLSRFSTQNVAKTEFLASICLLFMKIKSFLVEPYQILLTTGQLRSGALIKLTDENGNSGLGDIAPLPKWSRETLKESLFQLNQNKEQIFNTEWTELSCLSNLSEMKLLPSVLFGVESALLALLRPLPERTILRSALLMGSPEQILQQAELRESEGFTSAKLKVGHLKFDEAADLIDKLKDRFYLRIDVNRAWDTEESLDFFSHYPLNTFDYVEEPFVNPHDLVQFPHPLAIDESFPDHLSLSDLESFPTLKAVIYKPTIQGGLTNCLPLHGWTKKQGVNLVLSSSFESAVGIANITAIAHYLDLSAPIGIGTYHFLSSEN